LGENKKLIFGRSEKMKSSKFLPSVILVVFLISSLACAVPTLHWTGLGAGIGGYYNSPPTSGAGYGEVYPHGNWACEIVFDAVYNLPGYADGSPLVTMCLEWDEPLIGENDFTAVINDGAVEGGYDGTGYDALDAESAWLFNEYISGNTFGISNVNRRAAVVQEAIWSFEGELESGWSLYTETAGVKQSAIDAVAGGWVNNHIHVLNISWEDGTKGQDVLVKTPEPTSIMLLLSGLLLFRKK
jgi:hypothetical protein